MGKKRREEKNKERERNMLVGGRGRTGGVRREGRRKAIYDLGEERKEGDK